MQIPSLSSEHRLGFKDLLPPSPSVFSASLRNPTPPAISSSMDRCRSSSVMRQTFDEDFLAFRSAPPHMPNLTNRPDSSEDKLWASSLPTFVDMSSIRPPDYTLLMNSSREQLHNEMTQTIEQLANWLTILKGGLTSILNNLPDDVIEQEQEPFSAFESSLGGNPGQEMAEVWP